MRKIEQYRFVDGLCPFPSMEAEVDRGGKKYYVNINVNAEGQPEEILEDGCWVYEKPVDQIRFDSEESHPDIEHFEDFNEIFALMAEKWNAHPVIDTASGWMAWT